MDSRRTFLTMFVSVLSSISLAALLAGCGGGGGGGGGSVAVPNPSAARDAADIGAFTASINTTIQTYAKAHYGNTTFDNTSAPHAYDSNVTTIRASPDVTQVSGTAGGVSVTLKSGGQYAFLNPPPLHLPSWFGATQTTASRAIPKPSLNPTREAVGSAKACFIDTIEDDASLSNLTQIHTDVMQLLKGLGYSVDEFTESQVTLNVLQHLNQYGVVFVITHGVSTGPDANPSTDGFAMATGVQVPDLTSTITALGDDYTSGRVGVGVIPYNGKQQARLTVTNRFFRYYYDGTHGANFAHPLFYCAAGESFTNHSMPTALAAVGVASYLGWTTRESVGPAAGYALLTGMVDGSSLAQSYEAIIASGEGIDPTTGAQMEYAPSTGSTLQIINPGSGQTTSPPPTNPNVSVILDYQGYKPSTGVANPWDTGQHHYYLTGHVKLPASASIINELVTNITASRQSAGGSGFALSDVPSGDSFANVIGLVPGANTLEVDVLTTAGSASVQIQVQGPVATTGATLSAELSWDSPFTDLDLHLVRPGGDFLSTGADDSDCYWRLVGQTTSWGALLDVDAREGYGPEHITVSNPNEAGEYHIYVQYWSNVDYSTGDVWSLPTLPYLFVQIGNTTDFIVPYDTFNASDAGTTDPNNQSGAGGLVWDVCTVNAQTQTITETNFFTSPAAITRSVKSHLVKPHSAGGGRAAGNLTLSRLLPRSRSTHTTR